MRPSKSRAYCKDAQRFKIFFKTENKAQNFIKFNHAEMIEESGFAPTRCYYCIACDGWHVSSSRRFENAANKTELVIQAFTAETLPVNHIPGASTEDAFQKKVTTKKIEKNNTLTQQDKAERLLQKISQRIQTISLLLDKKSDKILIYNLIHESQRLLTKNRAPGFGTQIDEFKNLLHTQKAKANHIFKDP